MPEVRELRRHHRLQLSVRTARDRVIFIAVVAQSLLAGALVFWFLSGPGCR